MASYRRMVSRDSPGLSSMVKDSRSTFFSRAFWTHS